MMKKTMIIYNSYIIHEHIDWPDIEAPGHVMCIEEIELDSQLLANSLVIPKSQLLTSEKNIPHGKRWNKKCDEWIMHDKSMVQGRLICCFCCVLWHSELWRNHHASWRVSPSQKRGSASPGIFGIERFAASICWTTRWYSHDPSTVSPHGGFLK